MDRHTVVRALLLLRLNVRRDDYNTNAKAIDDTTSHGIRSTYGFIIVTIGGRYRLNVYKTTDINVQCVVTLRPRSTISSKSKLRRVGVGGWITQIHGRYVPIVTTNDTIDLKRKRNTVERVKIALLSGFYF